MARADGQQARSQSEHLLSLVAPAPEPELRSWANQRHDRQRCRMLPRAAVGAAGEKPRTSPEPPDHHRQASACHPRSGSLLPRPSRLFSWGRPPRPAQSRELVGQPGSGPSSTLLFTNSTRNQASAGISASARLPEMEDGLALHHSSIDRGSAKRIEAGGQERECPRVVPVRSSPGSWGWNFAAVERCADRLRQEPGAAALAAGRRSPHSPGAPPSAVSCPPTALELLELSALRRGAGRRAGGKRGVRLCPARCVVQQPHSPCLWFRGFEPRSRS